MPRFIRSSLCASRRTTSFAAPLALLVCVLATTGCTTPPRAEIPDTPKSTATAAADSAATAAAAPGPTPVATTPAESATQPALPPPARDCPDGFELRTACVAVGATEAELSSAMRDYQALGSKIDKGFDPGPAGYSGEPVALKNHLVKKTEQADDWTAKLDKGLAGARKSPLATAVAIARQCRLYHAVREGYLAAGPPRVKLFSVKEQAMLEQLEALAKDHPEAADKVQQLREKRQTMWDEERARASHELDRAALPKCALAERLAAKYRLADPELAQATTIAAATRARLGELERHELDAALSDPLAAPPR